jgi:hypothetical protein
VNKFGFKYRITPCNRQKRISLKFKKKQQRNVTNEPILQENKTVSVFFQTP